MSNPTETTLPPLSPTRAFVVELREPTRDGTELFRGRVEHVLSGQMTTFESVEELLAFVRVVSGSATPARI